MHDTLIWVRNGFLLINVAYPQTQSKRCIYNMTLIIWANLILSDVLDGDCILVFAISNYLSGVACSVGFVVLLNFQVHHSFGFDQFTLSNDTNKFTSNFFFIREKRFKPLRDR